MPGSGKYCAVFGCNNQEIQKDARSFFRFPRNKPQCDLWVLNCRRADLDVVYKKEGPIKLNNTYKICSDHFLISDFRNPRLFSQGLKPGSIPSQNLPNSSSTTTRRGGLRKRKRDEEVDSDCTVSAPPENELGKLLIVQKDILDNMKVELDSDSEVPLTSLPSDGELCEVIMEEPFAFVSVEHEVDDRVKEKLDSTLTDETHQSCSPPDGEICEVKLEEEPDPFTFVPVKIKMEEGLDVGIMEDELKCEVTVEEHEERSDGLLNSTLEEINKCGKRKPYICEVCGVSCNRKHLVAHTKASVQEKRFKCDTCNTCYKYRSGLREHIKAIHTVRTPVACEECGKTFLARSALIEHKFIHTGEKAHVCLICGKKFPFRCKLKVHQRTHTGEKPFSCDKCDQKYNQMGQLTIHMRTHTGEKPFLCDICNVSFRQKKHLAVHITLKHSEIKPHKCEICSMSFAINYHLEVHKRVHTGVRPHVCHICNKGFGRRRNLRNHLQTHSLGDRYTCTECGEGFSRNRNLEQHMKSHIDQL